MESMEERLLREYFGNDPQKMADARNRLAKKEPLAYILGETVFFRETYFVTPAVLIPRPDTERVVEQILRNWEPGTALLDLCTGSGCIAISSLCNSKDPNGTATAVDISCAALEIAQKNAKRNGVDDRIRFIRADIGDPIFLKTLSPKSFHIIASNPPYVRSSVVPTLEAECHYEPKEAFDGGRDGMTFYRLILEKYPPYLADDGFFIFEIGYDQRGDICTLAEEKGFSCAVYKDYGKNDRVAVLRSLNSQKGG